MQVTKAQLRREKMQVFNGRVQEEREPAGNAEPERAGTCGTL